MPGIKTRVTIRNARDHAAACARLRILSPAPPGTPGAEEYEELLVALCEYEDGGEGTGPSPGLGAWIVGGVIVAFLLLMALLGCTGCASTMTERRPDGSELRTKVGFGNRFSAGAVCVEPSPVVVAAGERVMLAVANRASDAILAKVVDGATSVSQ